MASHVKKYQALPLLIFRWCMGEEPRNEATCTHHLKQTLYGVTRRASHEGQVTSADVCMHHVPHPYSHQASHVYAQCTTPTQCATPILHMCIYYGRHHHASYHMPRPYPHPASHVWWLVWTFAYNNDTPLQSSQVTTRTSSGDPTLLAGIDSKF